MPNTSSKVAIVTGASGGIGAAIAQRLARDGLTVVVNYGGSAGPAEALVAKIESAGGRAVAAQADIADPAAVARLFDTAGAAFGGVDVVVNNAGVMQLATIAESDDALFDRQIAINLRGVFNTLREAARRLRAGGRIINISSSVTTLLQPTYGVYAATKAAVEAMTSVLTKNCAAATSPSTRSRRVRPPPGCSSTASRRRRSTASPRRPRSNGSASLRTSPLRSPFSPVRTAPGSTARRCAPMAGSSEAEPAADSSGRRNTIFVG
jgi:NAD(P)-dependent dehydrogenase (short-subunit alcohol dehydrogenase family)